MPPSLERVLIFVDEPCVIDGNLVSGRTYRDSGRFIGPWISLLDQSPGSASWISLLEAAAGRATARPTF